MSQLGLDFARAERDAAMERVADAAPPAWTEVAWAWLLDYLAAHETFFPDDAWGCGLPEPPNARAFGPVVAKAQRRGFLVHSGEMRPRTRGHATRAHVWRSMLYGKDAQQADMAYEAERFWSKVDIRDEDECWLWLGGLTSSGYGMYNYTKTKKLLAHRFAYEYHAGAIPDGLVLDHLCRNRACVNWYHLEPVTSQENTLRGRTLAAEQVTRTHCPRGHPYDEENTAVRRGKRVCRECSRIRSRVGFRGGAESNDE